MPCLLAANARRPATGRLRYAHAVALPPAHRNRSAAGADENAAGTRGHHGCPSGFASASGSADRCRAWCPAGARTGTSVCSSDPRTPAGAASLDPRLHVPAIDVRWDAPQEGPAKVGLSESGVRMDLEVNRVDPRFHGELTLEFTTEAERRCAGRAAAPIAGVQRACRVCVPHARGTGQVAAVSVSTSTPRTFAIASAVTGPARKICGCAPVRSTIVEAACCSDGPASR